MIFRRITHQWLWDTYDHLLSLLVANMLLFVAIGGIVYTWFSLTTAWLAQLPADVPAPIVVAMTALGGWVAGTIALTIWLAAYGDVMRLIALEKPTGWREYGVGLLRGLTRSFRFASLVVGCLVVLGVNVWAYGIGGMLPAELWVVSAGLAGIGIWLLLAWIVVCTLAIPWFWRGGLGVRSSLRRGLGILLGRPKLVLAVFVHLGLLWFFSIVLRLLGAFLVGFSLTATFLNSVYDVVEAEDRPQDHLPPPESAASWKEREQLEKAHEERRMNSLRYRRTMRDILRPWED